MSTETEVTYRELLRAAAEGAKDYPDIDNSAFAPFPSGGGATLRLPLRQLAAIGTDDVSGDRPSLREPVRWLAGDGDESPILARARIIPVNQIRGKLPAGTRLPDTVMTGPFGDNTGDFDPTIGDFDFALTSIIESRTSVNRAAIIQSSDAAIDDMVLGAQRVAIRDRMVQQILVGSGNNNQIQGIVNVAGVPGSSYPMADRGSSGAFQDGEDAVEDAGGRLESFAWALGSDLSSSARRTAIDPGGSRRTEERGRLTLSGVAVQRVGALPATMGVLADWANVLVLTLDELEVIVDAVSKPGDVRLTSRLPIAMIPTQPTTAYILRQS